MAGRLLRTLLGMPLVVLATIGCAAFIALGGESDFSERVLRLWARLFLAVAGARVHCIQGPPLDPARSYVFVCNHTSQVDVPAIVCTAPKPLRFIAKKELTWIPLFGIAARRMGHVFVDRKDRQAAQRAIAGRLARGLSGVGLFFFPEGTRSPGDELLPFKKGAAVAALESGVDVVPMAIAGAREVLRPKGLSLFRPGPVVVAYGAPLLLQGFTLEERDRLVAAQRAAIEGLLLQARAELRRIGQDGGRAG